MTFKRRLLMGLGKAELLAVGRDLELDVKSAMSVDDLRDVIASSKRAKLEKFVTTEMSLDQLKALCKEVDLDPTGNKKQALVERILAAGGRGDGGQSGLELPAPDVVANEAAKASQVKTPRVPKAKSEEASATDGGKVLSYRHGDRRRNNPEVGMVDPDTDPQQPRTVWKYDPHLDPSLQFDVGRAQVERLIDDALASGDQDVMRAALEQLRRQAEPYLAWTGKAERTSFEVDTVSLHVHERIDPASILAAVRKGMKAGQALGTSGRERPVQYGLFSAPFENLPLRDAIDFYKHDKGWSNRLIAGDSLLVMNSLLQKEGMAGQVQMIYIDPPYGIRYGSNFQPFVNKRDVRDRNDEDLTQEPEMLKAFRDTWELGLHSYLTYLGDRLRLAKDLLCEAGSVFVQISDENVHLVRNLLDEVFGVENFVCELLVKKKGSQKSTMIDPVNDYLVWYSKSPRAAGKTKFNALFERRELDADTLDEFNQIELAEGRVMNVRAAVTPTGEAFDYRTSPGRLFADYPDAKLFRAWPITNGGYRPNQSDSVDCNGISFSPPHGRCWSFRSRPEEGSTHNPMRTLGRAGRLVPGKTSLDGKRYLADFPYKSISNWWDGLGGASGQVYVVQTNEQIVQRCILMTSDPGDLVLDPTCGSGTTAVVSERWGRRWITCDTSRIAVTLAKQRLMANSYDYYELRYPHEGLKGGFVYGTAPHVMLSAVANNPELDEVFDAHASVVEGALKALNVGLNSSNALLTVSSGRRKGEQLHFGKKGNSLSTWEVPFEFPVEWDRSLRGLFSSFHDARRAMQAKMDQVIAERGEQETLYDQPEVDRNRLRITGPFTVEAVPFPTVLALDDAKPVDEADTAIARSGETSRQHTWRDELLKTGVRGKGGQMLQLASLEALPETKFLHGSGTLADSGDRIVVSFGPEHGALEQRQVEMAMREAGSLFPRPKMILYCAFAFDPEAAKDIDETRGITALKAQMNTDLLTEDLKKARSSNQSFWLMGQPDVEVRRGKDGTYQVEVNGFDYFDTKKGELISGGTSKIAMWSLDTDYDERSLYPHQVFFPMAGAKDGWYRLKKDLRAELDEGRLAKFHGTVSLPFTAGPNRKAAVKVVDDRGIESLKILSLD